MQEVISDKMSFCTATLQYSNNVIHPSGVAKGEPRWARPALILSVPTQKLEKNMEQVVDKLANSHQNKKICLN